MRIRDGVVLAGALATLVWTSTLSGCGGGSINRGSQCHEVLSSYCSRAAGCGLFPANQTADCVTAGVSTCCAGNCGAAVVSTEGDIRVCTDQINLESCADINAVTLPSVCMGVVRSGLTKASGALTSSAEPAGPPSSTTRFEQAGALISRDLP